MATLSPTENAPPININIAPRVLTPIVETAFESERRVNLSFHTDADLKVIVKDPNADVAVFMVCSSALCCASREWRCTLYRKATHLAQAKDEANEGQALAMIIHGNIEAITTIFRILHYEFTYVPKTPTLDQLHELAKNACQYKCTHIFHPWATQWLSSLEDFVASDNCVTECHKAIWIGWAFGDLQLYRDAVDTLIVSSKINANGKIVNIDGQPLEDLLMPPLILATITEIRAATVEKMLAAIKEPIEALLSREQGERTAYCKVGKDRESCEIMMLGSAITQLTKLGLFPIPEPEKFTGSVEELKDKLEGIKAVPFVGKDWKPHLSHESCNLGFRESIVTCLTHMAVPLCARIMGWVSKQADICGIEANKELKEWRLKSGSPSKRSSDSIAARHSDKQNDEEDEIREGVEGIDLHH